MSRKEADNLEINKFLEILFSHYKEGCMYYDEFVRLAMDVTSDLFTCIYNCIY